MDMGGVSYTPSEEPVRPDVDKLLNKEKYQFENWYLPRLEAVENELDRYELIGSIPNLSYGGSEQQHDMKDRTHTEEHLKTLEQAKFYLIALKEKWEERHGDVIIDW